VVQKPGMWHAAAWETGNAGAAVAQGVRVDHRSAPTHVPLPLQVMSMSNRLHAIQNERMSALLLPLQVMDLVEAALEEDSDDE